MSRRCFAYWHVDAFTARTFGGNQAAVMPLDAWLPEQTLTAIAAENMFAETAYLVPDDTGAADYELRWFTPMVEVALCGHATMASAHVLMARDGTDRVTFRTRKSGILVVSRAGEGYEMALPVTRVEEYEAPGLLAALGTAGRAYRSVAGAAATSIVLLDDEAAVRALEPDMAALARIEVMAICTAPGSRTDVVSRVFAPAWGIDEDPVTGSAHAALTPFWSARLGRADFTAHQASARGGDLTCRLDGEAAILGGSCVTVVEGQFFIEE